MAEFLLILISIYFLVSGVVFGISGADKYCATNETQLVGFLVGFLFGWLGLPFMIIKGFIQIKQIYGEDVEREWKNLTK